MADEIQDPSAMARALRWGKNQFSLDPQPDQDLISPETGGDLLLGSVPGVGQAMALRDMYRGYKADDPVAMGSAALGLVPFGKLGGVLKNKIIAGGRAAEAPLENMIKGRAALMKGADPEKVWQEHGTFRGYDKGVETGSPMKWEIPDTNAKLKSGTWDVPGSPSFTGKLSDIIDHPEFFKNYPEAADWAVNTLRKKGPSSGSFNWKGGPNLTPTMMAEAGNDQDLLKTLLHEMQHGVQRVEGFGRGGNSGEQMRRLMLDASADPSNIEHLVNPTSKLAKRIQNEAQSQYRRLPGEIESYSVEQRYGMTPEQLKKYSPARTAKNMGYGPETVHLNKELFEPIFP